MAGKTAYVRRVGSVMVPVGREQEEILRSIPERRWLKGNFVQERGVNKNAFFHALCGDLAKALNDAGMEDATLENVKDRLLMAIGHVEIFELPRAQQRRYGERYGIKVRSVNFNEVDEIEFSEILTKVTRFVIAELLPHIPYGHWTRQIEDRLSRYGVPPAHNAA